MVISVSMLNKGYFITPCRHPCTWCNSPSFSTLKVVVEEVKAVVEVAAAETTHLLPSSSSLLNDTQQSLLYANPSGEGKDSLCTVPTGEGRLFVHSPFRREKTPCVQFSNTFIPDQCFPLSPHPKLGVVPVGRRLRSHFLPEWKNQKAYWESHTRLIQAENAQNYPGFPASPATTVDLYSRPAAERRNRSRAYQKQFRILQSNVPGSQTRQPLEASHRPQFSKKIPGHTQIQDGNPRINTCLPQEGRVSYIHRPNRRLPTCPYSF